MHAVPTTVIVPARFNGPPTTAQGGYAAGLLGRSVGGPAEVTLWAPPPLERPLAVTRDGDALSMWDGDTLIAEAHPTAVDAELPATVSLEAAEAASAAYPGFTEHAFPTCVVCGPQRAAGDGLRVFPGPVPGTPLFAAPWVPDPELAHADGAVALEGAVAPEIVWAVLDCPSAFGGVRSERSAVLGRIAADLRAPVVAGEPHVALGWARGSAGRKHHAASAVTRSDGEVVAISASTWIEPREAAGGA